MSRVLLAEDEEHLALGLRFNLENAGHAVTLARSGEEALEALRQGAFDLAILDVMLADNIDGYAVARAIRRDDNFVPVLMLTARDRPADRVAGLDAGADDYLTKPFDLDELLARVRVLLRRQAWSRRERADEEGSRAASGRHELEVIEFDGCRVDLRSYLARTHDGQEVQLSDKEAQMMRLFALHEGEVISRATFLERVWGQPGTLETRTVDNFILRLRRYFEPHPRTPRHILSVRGQGYRFVR